MVWALLAILGVPIWLVLGVLGGAMWNRHRFKQSAGVFRLKFRRDPKGKWPRQAGYGRWVHDVLLINKGIGLVPTSAVGVKGLVEYSDSELVKGLDNALIFTYTLDDDSVGQIAVEGDVLALAQGPFGTGN